MVELNDTNSVPFPGIEGLKGYITVSGQPLPVHAIEQLGQKTVAYVESVSGAHFEVHVKDERREATDGKQFVVYLFADGEYVTGATIQEQRFYFHQPQDHKQRTLDFVGKRVSATSKAPLLFSSLRTTDDVDAACTDDRFLQDVGSIQLRYCRIKNVKERKKDPSRDSFSGSPAASISKAPIFEGTKKGTALSHQTAYGEAKTDIKTGSNDFEPIDHKGAPLSTLVFRYRSRRLLQFEGKIPTSPPPEPVAGPSSPLPTTATSRSSSTLRRSPSLEILPIASTSSALSPCSTTTSRPRKVPPPHLPLLPVPANVRSTTPFQEPETSAAKEKEIVALKRQLAALKGEGRGGETEDGGERKKVKTETEREKVKSEEKDEVERDKAERKKRGGKVEVLVLSDSE